MTTKNSKFHLRYEITLKLEINKTLIYWGTREEKRDCESLPCNFN